MRTLLILSFYFIVQSSHLRAQSYYFPPVASSSWDTVSPGSLGWNMNPVDSLYALLDGSHTKAFIVLKDGRIALEKYFGTFTKDSVWYWASAGKTVTSVLVGIAQQEGFLSISDTSSKWLGKGWTSLPQAKEDLITVRHQLTMTTGLDDDVADKDCTLSSCLVYRADAGTRWAYHNAPYTLLDSVLQAATGSSLNQFYLTRLRSKIGMNGAYFRSGYNNVLVTTPRSMARFGLLMLNRGTWGTTPVLADSTYFQAMVNTSQNINPSYGYLWWLNGKSSYMLPSMQLVFPGSLIPTAPNDMMSALGKNGQYINVVPSLGLVVIRMGDAPDNSLVPTTLDIQMWELLAKIVTPATDVEERSVEVLPDKYGLEQNFPNPFNPNAVFRFQVSAVSEVSLRVYDLLGREAAVLANGEKMPGSYSVTWDAKGMASGIYFYQLRAGREIFTKKMILLR